MTFDPNQTQWFYIRPKYRREAKVKQYFEEKHCEVFIPKHEVYRMVDGKRKTHIEPIVSGLVFVKTSYNQLKEEKKTMEILGLPFMLRMNTTNRKLPIIIPEKVMEDFIFVCQSHYSRNLEGVNMDKICKGDYVEIIDGEWRGVQGYYARPYKDKCVVVLIEGVGAVCTTYIRPELLKIIDKPAYEPAL